MFKNAECGLDALRRQRILIIDDDPQMRSLLVARLRREFLVAVASDGREGLQKAYERVPDVAIIDIHMPGWDGLQTTRELRKVHEFEQLRILILTADSKRECVTSAISAGADDFLLKTELTPELLLKKLRSIRRLNSPVAAERLAAREPQSADGSLKSHLTFGGRPTDAAPTHSLVSAVSTEEFCKPATADIDSQLQCVMDAWE